MNRRHEVVHLSALGRCPLQRLVRSALIMSEPLARAATSAATVGGPFTLTTPDGTTVTDQTYRGKWLLVYFGYTSCPDSCPTALFEIATALKKLGPDAATLQPLFITIDPQRDTPEVMGEYSQSFDPRIVGLTGTAEQIDAVARHTGPTCAVAELDRAPRTTSWITVSYIYLIEPAGQIRPRIRHRLVRRSNRRSGARTSWRDFVMKARADALAEMKR